MSEGDDGPPVWTFAKLTGPSDWARNMEFALVDADLWGNVRRNRLQLLLIGSLTVDQPKKLVVTRRILRQTQNKQT